MTKSILSRFKSDPLGFIGRALYKSIIGRLKYGRGGDYDAERYWHDRFSRYGLSAQGAGDEGLSEQENEVMYAEAGRVFTALCQEEGLYFPSLRVLEIGPGSGFYTELLRGFGVRDYVGADITDVLCPELRRKFPEFSFVKKDITRDTVDGKFDLILMIDVIEHIVSEEKFSCAMENVKKCLLENGTFMVAPITKTSKRHLFYVRWWSMEDIQRRFRGYTFREPVPFRNGHLLIVKKPQTE